MKCYNYERYVLSVGDARLLAGVGYCAGCAKSDSALDRVREPLMASVSRAGPNDGLTHPDKVEQVDVNPDDEEYGVTQRPVLVVMWHGNGYKRDDCWIQVDKDAACNLESWL